MKFKGPFKVLDLKEEFGSLFEGRFVERLNRFTALVKWRNSLRKAHVSDTGRLRELLLPGAPLLLASNPKGKLDFKLVAVFKGSWILLNTSLHSKIAEKVIKEGFLGFKPESIKREVPVGNSRIDFLLEEDFFLEVKGCNLVKGRRCLFPDAPTLRGSKHLAELLKLKREGKRAGVLFLCFRSCSCFSPNFETDPKFSSLLLTAVKEGVKLFLFSFYLNERGEVYLKSPINLCKSLKNF
ncbi:DNA/RNA nuclease SfsA [Thermovibrio sp.]